MPKTLLPSVVILATFGNWNKFHCTHLSQEVALQINTDNTDFVLCVVIVSVYCLMSCNIFYLDALFLAALKRRSTD